MTQQPDNRFDPTTFFAKRQEAPNAAFLSVVPWYLLEMSNYGPRFNCPCCGFPSLPQLSTAICDICWWEVIREMEVPESYICGGPNRGYSLQTARRNFDDHGHMYDIGKEIHYLKTISDSRARLMSYVNAVQRDGSELDQETLDQLLQEEREHQRKDRTPYNPEPAEAEEALLRALIERS